MRVYNSGTNGLSFPTQDVNYGWKTFARTISIYSTYTNSPVISFLSSGTSTESNLHGRASEVAFPTANQTEISYRNFAFSCWLYPLTGGGEIRVWTNTSSNGNGPIKSFGSPYTQFVSPVFGSGVSSVTFYARSKDYNTTHCIQYTMFCQDWSTITVTYP